MLGFQEILARGYIQFDGSGTKTIPLVEIPYLLERFVLSGLYQKAFDSEVLEEGDTHDARQLLYPTDFFVSRCFKRVIAS